jgi:hypothetical protein
VLIGDGRREAVVVTALEKRLLINVEADISAIPIGKVRRDDGLNLRRTDRRDWQVRFDQTPPADSWVFDLPMMVRASLLRRLAMLLLALLGLLALGWWAIRDGGAGITPEPLPDLAKAIAWPVPQSLTA